MAARHSRKELFSDLYPGETEEQIAEKSADTKGEEGSSTENTGVEEPGNTTEETISNPGEEQYKRALQLMKERTGNTETSGKTPLLKRTSVTFTPDINEYINIESRRRGMHVTEFVNMIIREYKNSPNAYITL